MTSLIKMFSTFVMSNCKIMLKQSIFLKISRSLVAVTPSSLNSFWFCKLDNSDPSFILYVKFAKSSNYCEQ